MLPTTIIKCRRVGCYEVSAMQDLNKEDLVSLLSSLHHAIQLFEASSAVAEECDTRVSALVQLVSAYETDHLRKVMGLEDGISENDIILVEELLAVRAKVKDARARLEAAQKESALASGYKSKDADEVRKLRSKVQAALALD